jgi:penicillin-binding protein 1A
VAIQEGAVAPPRTKSRKRKKPAWVRRAKWAVSLLALAFSLGFVVFGAMFWTQLNWAAGVIPTLEEKLVSISSAPSRIISADGKTLFVAQTEYREPIRSLDEIPRHVRNATLAAEDRRFYDHVGVDWVGVGRALLTNVREGRTVQGASTITMQLAKRLYTGPERTFTRKLKDMAIAVQMEKKMTKDEILRIYLNQVFYGSGAYGIRAASKTYFGKDVSKLTVAEAALLARVVRRPSEENPFADLERALANRNVVLREMLEEKMISREKYEQALAEEPKLMPKRFASGSHIQGSPYFVRYVLDTIQKELPGVDITAGGYRIETTLDSELNTLAQKKVQEVVRKFRRQKVTTGAFVLLDDEGRVLAMVGGVDYDRNEYNVIYQGRRQPGSAFKPFVYAAALSTGAIGPHDSISNEPYYLDDPVQGRKRWPKNANGRYGGRVSVRTAIASSINIPAVRVCEMVSPAIAANYARDVFGIRSPLEPVLSLALGSSAVSPLEMAKGYSVFMNMGDRARPYGIKRIIGPDGEVIKEWGPEVQRSVLDPAVCVTMDEFLRATITGGTGGKARAIAEARGKTGTTSDNRDAWFCGYAKGLVGVGWVANENKRNGRWYYDTMPNVYGGTVAIEIWTAVMKEAVGKHGKDVKKSVERLRPLTDYHEEEPAPAETPVDSVAAGDPPAPPPDLPRELEPGVPEPGELFPADQVPDSPAPSRPPPSRSDRERDRERPPIPNMVQLEICADSGQIAHRYCPETVTRALLRKDAPKARCPMHGP